MKHLIAILLFIGLAIGTRAQQLTGVIKDVSTNQPLPFVSVGIKGTPHGTVTNEQGGFVLTASALPITLVISHLGYQAIEQTISNINQNLSISLTPQSTQLPEVTVGNPALSIMQSTVAKVAKTVRNEYFPKVFFRRLTLEGDKPTFFAESFLDAQWQAWGLTKYKISNSRYLQSDNGVNYNNIAMFNMLCSGYVGNSLLVSPIFHKPDSLYKFSIKETFKANGHEIAVIKCELKDQDFAHTAFEGDYYIDTENYNILKTDGTIHHFMMTASGPFNLKVKDVRLITQYKLDADSNMVLDYSNFTLKSTLKAGFVGLKQLTYSGQIFALDYPQSANKTGLADVTLDKLQKEEEKFKSVAYDPGYWKNNPVIKRTSDEDTAVTQLEQLKKVKGNIDKQ
ncbi:carboxypeptidase-like regulatory domain-containing protein [Mucilaginibacter jinjuensis]|uniref:Carboxypeptidase-like regulatory domain-containing protein n=1 Tax=Mucilaginibacter jinjuensis TaxID=1176721 RepID=A0ABY7T6C4_9SPHI|nr:carboxypeptidase-like regulatory domain-containing protein [Mucilaginibacter jinjuensis]WCT11318.1 carboxypeptidase-like regulatory domain-containing protein [Mucilaginibacter jinjuensis]